MSLFKSAVLEQSYLKAGLYGEAGSGKTYTASLIALGLHKLIASTKPIAFFDTEVGAEYVLKTLFEPAKVKLVTVKSRAFSDLMAALEEARTISDILIVDSLTHLWTELQDAYRKKNNIQRLEFQDWSILKPEWNRFTTAYLNAPLHIIVAGRSKDDYTYEQTERGKKELIKTGTRMATEKNLSYEPSLLVEMEKVIDVKTGFWVPRAWVLKDRFSQIDGKAFDKPTFETFLPHIKMLNLGGKQVGVDTTRTSEALFSAEGDTEWIHERKQREIILEEIEGTIVYYFPGQSADDKKIKAELINSTFGGYSWVALKEKTSKELKLGLEKIKLQCETIRTGKK